MQTSGLPAHDRFKSFPTRPHLRSREAFYPDTSSTTASASRKFSSDMFPDFKDVATAIPNNETHAEPASRAEITYAEPLGRLRSASVTGLDVDHTRKMTTKVAIIDKSPHRFQVVPLRDARSRNLDPARLRQTTSNSGSRKGPLAFRTPAHIGTATSTSQEPPGNFAETRSSYSYCDNRNEDLSLGPSEEPCEKPRYTRKNSFSSFASFTLRDKNTKASDAIVNKGVLRAMRYPDALSLGYQDLRQTKIDRYHTAAMLGASSLRIRGNTLDESHSFDGSYENRETLEDAGAPRTPLRRRTKTHSDSSGLADSFDGSYPLQSRKPPVTRRRIDVTKLFGDDHVSNRSSLNTISLQRERASSGGTQGVVNGAPDSRAVSFTLLPTLPLVVRRKSDASSGPLRRCGVREQEGKNTDKAIRARRRHAALLPLDLNLDSRPIVSSTSSHLSLPIYYSSFVTIPSFHLHSSDEGRNDWVHPIILDLVAELNLAIDEWKRV